MKVFENKVIVITGAGSGIGKELAIQCAQENAKLAISDINSEKLSDTVKTCKQWSESIISADFDVSSYEAFVQFRKQVLDAYGHLDIMINNAGVALGGFKIEDTKVKDFEWLMGINFWGMVYGSQLFLPALKERPESALVNVSSVFGLAGIALNGAYCASKFAIRGFTESLRMESYMEFPHVKIQSVHPGGIQTNIVKNAKWNESMTDQEVENGITEFEEKFPTTAKVAAQTIIKGIKKKKERILIGNDAKALDKLVRLMPVGYTKITLKQLESD